VAGPSLNGMGHVTGNQPLGTPTWIVLGVPDLERASAFYGALFGWRFERVGPYTVGLVDGFAAAAFTSGGADRLWNVYLATDDCDATAKRAVDAGGTVVASPTEVHDLARIAVVTDPVGARFGLWQGRSLPGCQVVNEPNSLVRNDLVTPTPEPAREFYAAVFGFTLDRNEDMPDFDFTFLRRPDGHEVAGIFGAPGAPSSDWSTTFEVADTDVIIERTVAAGGNAAEPQDMLYGRFAEITDPFGTQFSVIARPQAS
jgi:uncharacterized protein